MNSRRILARPSWTVSLAVVGALLAVGGCGTGSSNEAAPASASSTHASAPTQGGTTASASPSSGSPAAAAPVGGVCPVSTTAATIGGEVTCLAPGQQCTKLNRDEYPVYGFLCLPEGAQFVLKRK
jgi:hypothetical protein